MEFFWNPTIMPIDISIAEINEEIWVKKAPAKADHIRVQRWGGTYAHHGIYVSDDEVIHFTGTEDDSVLDWSKAEVIKTDLDYFLKDGVLEVKEYTDEEVMDLYPVDAIVNYARACLGDKDYNLFFNNCEHFANYCTLGRFRSHQVENLGRNKVLSLKEDGIMGFWDSVKSFFGFGSSGGSRTTSSYTYEPDKVKVAEIESETKIRLANMERERIEIMKEAKLEILQFETESQIAIEKARADGFALTAQRLMILQEKLSEVAEQRLLIIEKGSMQVINDIHRFYAAVEKDINAEGLEYSTNKLPALLNILGKYEKGSAEHTLYAKRIEEDMAFQQRYLDKKLDDVLERQRQIIDGFLRSKDRILEQTGSITAGLIENLAKESLMIGQTIKKEEVKALPDKEVLALPETSDE